MADSDSFVQEVTEEVRRDAMFAAWRKYGPWVIGAIVLIILGTAGRAWYLNAQTQSMRERGGAYLAAQKIEDAEASAKAFGALAIKNEGDLAALSALRAGAAFGQTGDVARAIESYESVLGMQDVDPRLKSLADLRIVMAQADTMEPDALLERLAPLTEPGRLWRPLALEFQANAYLRKGDDAGALTSLRELIDDNRSPVAAKTRAAEMIAALGREAADTEVPAAAEDAPSQSEDSQ